MKLLPQASHLCGFPPRGPPCWVPRPEPPLRLPASSTVRPGLPSILEAPCDLSQVPLFWERGPALGGWPAGCSRLGSCPKLSPTPGLWGRLLSRVLSTPPAWCTSSSGACGQGDDGACSGSDSEPEERSRRGGQLSAAVPHGTPSHPGCLCQGGSGWDLHGLLRGGTDRRFRLGDKQKSPCSRGYSPAGVRLPARKPAAAALSSLKRRLAKPERLHRPPGDTTRASLGERRGRVRRQRDGGAERLGG